MSKIIGDDAEQLAHDYLVQHGLMCLKRNFACKAGEIDLIMQDDTTLVFVEVRYRQSQRFGGALASVTPSKQQKLIKTAHYYLQQSTSVLPVCRFDVMALSPSKGKIDIQWIQNAFQLD